jgi:hypothetical protein
VNTRNVWRCLPGGDRRVGVGSTALHKWECSNPIQLLYILFNSLLMGPGLAELITYMT